MNHNTSENNFDNKPKLREQPPRHLNKFTKITLINGGIFTQMSWGLVGFGMIFFWTFVLQSEAKYLLSFDGNWEETSGVVEEIKKTGAEENNRRIYQYIFTYNAGGQSLSNSSYSSSNNNIRMHDVVTINYKSGNHQRAKIEGMTSEMFSTWIVLVMIFPILGFLLLIGTLYSGKQMVNLLINGKFIYGTQLSKKDSGSRVNKSIVWSYEFSFMVNNQSYIAKCKTHKTHLVEDETKELILYMPDNPDNSTVFDAIPGVPNVDSMGKLEASPTSNAKYLILPVLAIVVNVILAYFTL